jgi:CRP-like cAMP-binding protein
MSPALLQGSVLQNSALFAGMEQDTLDSLARLSRHIALNRGATLFRKGDPCDGCYSIIEGVLKVSAMSQEGEEVLLAVVGSGDVIGEMGLIDGAPRSADVTALTVSSLAFLPSHDFRRFAESNPVIYRHMLEIICARLRASNEAFIAYQLLPLAGRLAHVMLRLAEGFGEVLEDRRILIRQKFTQTDLARMTGTARENVNRQLKTWCADGIVSRISHYYCIDTPDRLRAIAER